MAIFVNHTKQVLRSGGVALGLGVRLARSVEIGLIAKASGFDFLFIDREHSPMDMATAAELCVGALTQGITPIVRVPGPDAHHFVPLLDSGAQGICLPHVESADDARALVNDVKFAPLGKRSISRTSPSSGYEPMPIDRFTREGNEQTLVIPMLESPGAVERAEEIAAVEGVDVLLIGTSDLCIEFGVPGQFGDPRVVAAYERVIAACRRHGKYCGLSGVREEQLARRYMKMGASFVLVTSDVPLLIEAGKARTQALR